MIFTSCIFFFSCLCNPIGLESFEPSDCCQHAQKGGDNYYSEWTLLQCPEKFKKYIMKYFLQKHSCRKTECSNMGKRNKEESGLMVHLNLSCCIFDENESEEFQNCLEKVDALAKPESDQALSKFNDDGYNEFKKASQEN